MESGTRIGGDRLLSPVGHVLAAFALVLSMGQAGITQSRADLDVVIRHGTVLDGSGRSRFEADVGIRGGYIVAIGDLGTSTAGTEIDATGLFVSPGFINIHAHPSPRALRTAVNMLTQGVTTEIMNADGAGPLNIAEQLAALEPGGLAVNVGAYIGFNTVWRSVVGDTDRRPSTDDITAMRALITAGLEQGAWGVSAGLDYKPGYYARPEEVIRVVEVARPWRTNFTNHDRLAPESNWSSRLGMAETVTIGAEAGLLPVVTHMKVQGHEQGTAGDVLASMQAAADQGVHTAADAYPYLAGQSSLTALIVPGWAQEGGRDAMLERFADPVTRARIVREAEQALTARFGGPGGVYLLQSQRELAAVVDETGAGSGETILRILEAGDPGAILRFGIEADLIKILAHPTTSMACDCGASTSERVHPRFFGSYPRLLGRYVREQGIMSWEEAIRKSSALPASTIGMTDRGLIAVGLAADITVFDPNTVIDHATYENPTVPSEGIRFVIVNGEVAFSDGQATAAQGGRTLTRSANMPSRAMNVSMPGRLTAGGLASGRRVDIDISQAADDRVATGRVVIEDLESNDTITITAFGSMQYTPDWASISGMARLSRSGDERAVVVIVDQQDPAAPDVTTIVVILQGAPLWRGTLPRAGGSIR